MLQICSKEDSTLSIGQMAKVFNISRQTLIHYDRIDLFKPSFLDKNGYRFYCACQIPKLREITFLKCMGMKLEMIKKIVDECDPYDFMNYLGTQKRILDEEINRLTQYRHHLNARLNLFSQLNEETIKINEPFIEEYPERFYLFEAFPKNKHMDLELINSTFMKLWDASIQEGTYHLHGFGVLFKSSDFSQDSISNHAGIFIILDETEQLPPNTHFLKKSCYLSMYKYGMPYDHKDLMYLLDWAKDHGYVLDGDILDLCIYNKNDENDFCLLQIPIANE